MVAPVAAGQLLLAALAASQPALALGLIAGVVVVAAALLAPLLLLIGAFPATFAYWRVGPGLDRHERGRRPRPSSARWPRCPMSPGAARRCVACSSPRSATPPCSCSRSSPIPRHARWSRCSTVTSMVVGAVLIGAAVARLGKVRLALRAFLATAARHLDRRRARHAGSPPAARLPLRDPEERGRRAHRDGVWSSCSPCPRRVGLPRLQTAVLSTILLVGLAASEARGPALALVAVFAIHLLRQRKRGGCEPDRADGSAAAGGQRHPDRDQRLTYRDRDLNAPRPSSSTA